MYVLCIALLLSIAQGEPKIDQTPSDVTVKTGGSFTLRCVTNEAVILTEVSNYNHQHQLVIRTNGAFKYDQTKIDVHGIARDLNVTVRNVDDKDKDIYYCWGITTKSKRKVEINGGGTNVRVINGVNGLFPNALFTVFLALLSCYNYTVL